MTTAPFNLETVHPSWEVCLKKGLAALDPSYLQALTQSHWLPGPDKIFSAFSLPLEKVNYVLFGESPYPRAQSANGYAFWDAAVAELWSPSGLSKKVNRATSLRNILKMLLIAEGVLQKNETGQEAIAKANKENLIQTNDELFNKLLSHGFLLLNATPVLQEGPPQKDAKMWLSFTNQILNCLLQYRPQCKFILFGRIANTIDALLPNDRAAKLYAEHPYNLSFITNTHVLDFFKPLHLLRR